MRNAYGELLTGGNNTQCGRETYPNLCVIDEDSLVGIDDDAVPGRFTVSYTIRNFGEFRLNVTLGGVHIRGSPFNLSVRGGRDGGGADLGKHGGGNVVAGTCALFRTDAGALPPAGGASGPAAAEARPNE